MATDQLMVEEVMARINGSHEGVLKACLKAAEALDDARLELCGLDRSRRLLRMAAMIYQALRGGK